METTIPGREMPKFHYKAKRGPDEVVEGDMIAENSDQVVVKLDQMDLIPVSIIEGEGSAVETQKDQGSRSRRPVTRSRKIRTKDIDAFTWQLASLVKASVPILRSLTLIAQQTDNRSFQAVVEDLKQQVKDGKTLSEGMRRYPKLFNNLFLGMVQSGEQGGVLDEVLYKIAEYREKEQKMRRKIQAALAYPMVMLVVGIGTVFVMLTFFMPKFIGIFDRMKRELPLPTKVLISASNFMSEHWMWFIFAFVFVFILFGRMRPGGKKKFFFDLIKLHTPLIKQFIRDAEIAKFCRTLGMLLKNGLPVYESLTLATNTLDNEALRKHLEVTGKDIVNQGSTLSASLGKIKIFPNFAINMIAVGEEGGKLEGALNGVAEAYEKEVEQAISVMTSLLEPLLILAIGGIVGFIVFAMMLPIFDIGVMAK
ncbi:MAG: type II secretion system F family protein [Candidatus Omnitrophica bacterium]|nr:type II secretion system F family protein [Candidatus Omnitrophota bacterium]